MQLPYDLNSLASEQTLKVDQATGYTLAYTNKKDFVMNPNKFFTPYYDINRSNGTVVTTETNLDVD